MRYRLWCVMTACGLSLCLASVAQAGGRYMSAEMGINIAPAAEIAGSSNDSASHCDTRINEVTKDDNGGYPSGCRAVGATGGGTDYLYQGDSLVLDDFSDFDGTIGILAGMALGYSFADAYPNDHLGGLRVEAEYFYRGSRYDQRIQITRTLGATAAKLATEFDGGPFSRLGNVTSHNLFGNVYYDLRNMDWLTKVVGRVGSRLTPYIGVGGGIGFTDADWHINWTRTSDPEVLRQGLRDGGRPDLAATAVGPVTRNLAGNVTLPDGTTTESYQVTMADVTRNNAYIGNLVNSATVHTGTLSDVLYGFQVLLGLDYAATEDVSLGLKGRYVHFASFDDTIRWNQLRGHAPHVGGTRDHPTRPVRSLVTTDDVGFFAVSINMKYHF